VKLEIAFPNNGVFDTRIEGIHRLQTGFRPFLLPLPLFRLSVQMKSSEASDSSCWSKWQLENGLCYTMRTITGIYMSFTLFILRILCMILTTARRIFIYSRKNMTVRSRCPCSAAARLPCLNPVEITCVYISYLLSVL
jgi:hypothetical protein